MPHGGFSVWQVGQWIDDLIALDPWLGVVTDDPRSVVDPFSVEALGGSYEREQGNYVNAGNAIVVSSTVVFLGLPADTHVAGVLWATQDTGGHFIGVSMLATADQFTLSAGGVWVVDADTLLLGVDLVGP